MPESKTSDKPYKGKSILNKKIGQHRFMLHFMEHGIKSFQAILKSFQLNVKHKDTAFVGVEGITINGYRIENRGAVKDVGFLFEVKTQDLLIFSVKCDEIEYRSVRCNKKYFDVPFSYKRRKNGDESVEVFYILGSDGVCYTWIESQSSDRYIVIPLFFNKSFWCWSRRAAENAGLRLGTHNALENSAKVKKKGKKKGKKNKKKKGGYEKKEKVENNEEKVEKKVEETPKPNLTLNPHAEEFRPMDGGLDKTESNLVR